MEVTNTMGAEALVRKYLEIPKLRKGSCMPSLLEPRRRAEQA